MMIRHVLRLALILLLLWSNRLLAGEEGTAKKMPAPDAASQQTATATIRETLSDAYASKDKEARLKLADQLQNLAGTEKDPKLRYVMLKEAAGIAAVEGDAVTALAVIDQMAENYQMGILGAKLQMLELATKKAKSREEQGELAGLHAGLIETAIIAEDYELAYAIVSTAQKLARRAKDEELGTELKEKATEIKALRAEYTKVRKAAETLKARPDDPDACLAVGSFRCFVLGNWEDGLPLLAKGSDQDLSALASTDMKKPTIQEVRLILADTWWKLSESEKSSRKKLALRERAAHWYSTVIPQLTGLAKLKVEKRLATVEKDQKGKPERNSQSGNRQGTNLLSQGIKGWEAVTGRLAMEEKYLTATGASHSRAYTKVKKAPFRLVTAWGGVGHDKIIWIGDISVVFRPCIKYNDLLIGKGDDFGSLRRLSPVPNFDLTVPNADTNIPMSEQEVDIKVDGKTLEVIINGKSALSIEGDHTTDRVGFGVWHPHQTMEMHKMVYRRLK